jgi:ABC-type glycerol-3-phosphate transport system substrate-binding protein
MRKPVVIILLAVVAVSAAALLLWPKKIGPAQENRDIIFWHAMGGPIGDVLVAMVAEFNRTHPEFRIVPQSMGNYNALSQKLLASVIAGNQPHIAQAYQAWIAKFVKGGQLVPLDEFIPDTAAFLRDFYPALVDDNTYDGRLMSLPFNKSTPVIYYDKDMFKAAGLDPAKPPRTWDEFRDACRAIARPPSPSNPRGIKGFVSGVNVSDFECFLYQNGGTLFSVDDPSKPLFNSPEALEAVRFFLDLKYIDKAADYYIGSGFEFQNDFLSRQSAMFTGSCVTRTYIISKITFNWGVAALLKKKKKAGLIYGTNIVLFKKGSRRKQRAAWDFIEWFTNPVNQAAWAIKTGYLPARRSSLDLPEMKAYLAKDPDALVIIRQMEEGFIDPKTEPWFLGRQYLEKALANIFISGRIQKAYEAYGRNDLNGPAEEVARLDRTVNAEIMKELDKAVKNTRKWFL